MRTVAFTSAAGFVLAGGRSSRMGTDKALTLLTGIPLIQIAIQTLVAAGVPAKIAGSRSPLAAFAQEIPDTFADAGPLGGIHAALSASPVDWNLFLPVDLPRMPASLLACLLQRAAITGQPISATRLNGRLEPFPVVLHRSVLPLVARCLETGHRSPAVNACLKNGKSEKGAMVSMSDSFLRPSRRASKSNWASR